MNRKEGKEQRKSEAEKEKEDPEEDIRTLRLWAGRARVFHEQAEERERLLAAGGKRLWNGRDRTGGGGFSGAGADGPPGIV